MSKTKIKSLNYCPYCGAGVKLQDSAIIYSKSYGNIYLCTRYPKCDAFVGVHKKTNKPLGTLANSSLRELRKLCHKHFDKLWRKRGWKRTVAYLWLSTTMGIPKSQAHIGYFTENQCRLLLKKVKQQLT